jgi:hypothetical protein
MLETMPLAAQRPGNLECRAHDSERAMLAPAGAVPSDLTGPPQRLALIKRYNLEVEG